MARSSKASKDENRTLLLNYLRENNRPFSAQLLETNLHGALTKTQIGKILDEEAERGTVVKKMLGKSPLYWPSQKEFGTVTDEELASLDAQLIKLQEELKAARAALAATVAANRLLEAAPTTHDAGKEMAAINEDISEKTARLVGLREGRQAMTTEDKASLERNYVFLRAAWRRRKRLSMEVISQMREGTGLSMKDLKASPGIETDSDCDVRIDSTLSALEKRIGTAAVTTKKRARRR